MLIANRMPLYLSAALVLGCALGCAHHEKKTIESATAQAPPAAARSTSAQPGGNLAGGKLCSQDLECGPRQLCIHQHCVDITPDLAECSSGRVHFDFDAAEVHPDDRPVLERMARCLKADRALHVTVEGNADERGTQDYNLALGDRRATGVARYLELLGVSDAQLKTVSYGKEQPLCSEHDEACWAKNRRAALKPKEARR
jgi:peptidoglycan-associated lipoprotein